MTRSPDYKTLNDGSIDYAHYIRESHAIRSRSAHSGLQWLAALAARLLRRKGAQAGLSDFAQRPARAGRRPSPRPVPAQRTLPGAAARVEGRGTSY